MKESLLCLQRGSVTFLTQQGQRLSGLIVHHLTCFHKQDSQILGVRLTPDHAALCSLCSVRPGDVAYSAARRTAKAAMEPELVGFILLSPH